VGAAAALGDAMIDAGRTPIVRFDNRGPCPSRRRNIAGGRLRRVAAVVLGLVLGASSVLAADRYALIVSGASGGEKYASDYEKWSATLATALRDKLAFGPDHVFVLSESSESDKSTRENVRRVMALLRARVQPDDLLLVTLIGHGTYDGMSAKFNLVGPDLDAKEWQQLFEGFPGRLILVDTTGSSFPFLKELAGKGRIVITATDSSAQRYDTVFPEFFVAALDELAADSDKNGRISIWEAFGYTSQAVQRWFEQRGQLSTERALIDDNGDGVGKEAQVPGPDGIIARGIYLDPDPTVAGADAVLAGLQKRRAAVEAEIEALKAKKGAMGRDQYDAEFEKLAIELARISRVIRARS
jgi:hypothetical protein